MSFAFITWLVMIIISFIIGLCQIYGVYCFNAISNLIIVQKRYGKLVMIEAVSTIFLCFITIPFAFNYLLQATTFNAQIIYPMGPILISFNSNFIANIEAARLWLISFKLHYLHSCKNEKWKGEIDNNFSVKNWYLSNKNKYGKAPYIIPRVIIFFIIASSITTAAFLYFGLEYLHFAELIHAACMGGPVMIVLYCYHKCPKHTELEDKFFFHYEFRISGIIYFTQIMVLYPIVQIVYYIQCKNCILIHNICMFFSTIVGLIIPSLLSTLWISRYCILMDTAWNTVISGLNTIIIDGTHDKEKLQMILSDEQKCELFIHWMFREFSSETILSFIEFVQFKQYLIDIVKQKYNENIECQYIFYENMPKSSIVYMNDKANEKKEKEDLKYQLIAERLYGKYIKEFSEFEVNISGVLRDKYQQLNEKKWKLDIKELINVFDEVIDEMYYLMKQSWTRFRSESLVSSSTPSTQIAN